MDAEHRHNIRFINRIALSQIVNFTIAISAVNQLSQFQTTQTFPLQANQAFRIYNFNAQAFDPGITQHLSVNALTIAIILATGLHINILQPQAYPVNPIVATSGVVIYQKETPLYYAQDLLNLGGAVGNTGLILQSDVSNSDAAATHTLSTSIAAIVEIYELSNFGIKASIATGGPAKR